jgi:hypothetical protein
VLLQQRSHARLQGDTHTQQHGRNQTLAAGQDSFMRPRYPGCQTYDLWPPPPPQPYAPAAGDAFPFGSDPAKQARSAPRCCCQCTCYQSSPACGACHQYDVILQRPLTTPCSSRPMFGAR